MVMDKHGKKKGKTFIVILGVDMNKLLVGIDTMKACRVITLDLLKPNQEAILNALDIME